MVGSFSLGEVSFVFNLTLFLFISIMWQCTMSEGIHPVVRMGRSETRLGQSQLSSQLPEVSGDGNEVPGFWQKPLPCEPSHWLNYITYFSFILLVFLPRTLTARLDGAGWGGRGSFYFWGHPFIDEKGKKLSFKLQPATEVRSRSMDSGKHGLWKESALFDELLQSQAGQNWSIWRKLFLGIWK